MATASVEEQGTQERVSCLNKVGYTDWSCCVEHDLDALGCEFCQTRFPNDEQAKGCLTCSQVQAEDPECCTAVITAMERIGMSNEDDPLGCAPWGPPAPPRHREGISLRDFVPRACPSSFRRERGHHAAA